MFNLVYVNNAASIKCVNFIFTSVRMWLISTIVHDLFRSRLWDALGFTRAGLIPNAGRLKKEGGGEEYIDAIIFYKSFIDNDR